MAADVATTLYSWSTTRSSNQPAGTTTVGTNWDDNLREMQGVTRGWLASKGADIASAATTDLGAIEGLFHDITGTTTITGFGTVSAGIWKIIKFEGILTLTHNATSLILPGGANITTADGDVGIFSSEGSGNWRCAAFMRAASIAATLAGTETLTNKTLTSPTINTPTITTANLTGVPVAPTAAADTNTTQLATTAFVLAQAASQAEMETASSTSKFVTAGRLSFHPSAAKFWATGDFAGSIAASYNVSSLTDGGTGIVTVNLTTGFSSASYAAICSTQSASGVTVSRITSKTTTACRMDFHNLASALVDVDAFNVVGFGDV